MFILKRSLQHKIPICTLLCFTLYCKLCCRLCCRFRFNLKYMRTLQCNEPIGTASIASVRPKGYTPHFAQPLPLTVNCGARQSGAKFQKRIGNFYGRTPATSIGDGHQSMPQRNGRGWKRIGLQPIVEEFYFRQIVNRFNRLYWRSIRSWHYHPSRIPRKIHPAPGRIPYVA